MSEAAAIKDFSFLRGQVEPQSTIIAIGGGKGGVGKSFVSSSLAIFLAHQGHDTVLMDLDLGSANLHTCIGENGQLSGINDFLNDPKMPLENVVHPTAYPNLRFIPGAAEMNFDTANISEEQKSRLMSAIFNLNAKYIVLDLSAGTHAATLDFFLMASRRLVVFTPEPSSIENAYRFMKAAFYRRIRRFEFQLHLQELITSVMVEKARFGIRSPADLLRVVSKEDPGNGERLRKVMETLRFELILNQTRSFRDVELGPQLKSVCYKYFGIPCNLLGHVEHDNAVWQALRKRKPMLIEYPHSRLYAQLLGIARRLINDHSKKAAM